MVMMMMNTCAIPDKKMLNYIKVKCSSMNPKTKFLDYVKAIRKNAQVKKG